MTATGWDRRGGHAFDASLMYRAGTHEQKSDAKSIAASVPDAGAFSVLYDRYAKRLRRYHLRRCGDEEAALDLLAETFAQAWSARRAFRDEAGGSAAPWLYGIARNALPQSVHRQRLEDGGRQRLGILQAAERPQTVRQQTWLDGG